MSPAPVTISIVANNAEDVSDNGYGQTQFSLQKQLSYNPVGIITYESGFLMTAAGAPVLNREIQKAEEGNYFLIPSAWVSGTDFSFYFDGQNLEWYSTSTGMDGGYGDIKLEMLDYAITSTSPLTLQILFYIYDSSPWGEFVETFTFPEGFTF